MNKILDLFEDWADKYDDDIDEVGGPLTDYRDSLDQAYENHPQAGENILDIGVGTGNFIEKYIEDSSNAYATDISPKMLDEAKKKFPSLTTEVADFNKIPFEDGQFDLIISSFAFHEVHMSDRSAAIKEVSRLLKAGGTFNLLDIGFKSKMELEAAQAEHYEEWDESEQYHYEYELVQYVEDAGMLVEKIDYPSDMHINVIAKKA